MITLLMRLFCRHKKRKYCQKVEPFTALNGTTVYCICERCGKVLSKEFVSTEDFYNRFQYR